MDHRSAAERHRPAGFGRVLDRPLVFITRAGARKEEGEGEKGVGRGKEEEEEEEEEEVEM